MKLSHNTNKFGTFVLDNGIAVNLVQDAYRAGTYENPVYQASGYLASENPEDETGPTVKVTWGCANLDADDESDCCDWDSPISINHYAKGELI